MAIAFDPGSATAAYTGHELVQILPITQTERRDDEHASNEHQPFPAAAPADSEPLPRFSTQTDVGVIDDGKLDNENEDDEADEDGEYTYDQLSDTAKEAARYEVIVDDWRAGWIADDIHEMIEQELDRYGFSSVAALFDNQYPIDMVFKGHISPDDLSKGMATVRRDCAEGYTDTIAHDGTTIALLNLLERYPTHDIAELTFAVRNERYGQGLPRMYVECRLDTWRDPESLSARERLCLKRLEHAKDRIEEAFEEFIQAVRTRMTKMIIEEIEYRESDECIEDEIDANEDWRFDIDGNRI
jgi:hypothetical protein